MTAVLVVLGLIVVGGAGYVALNPEALKATAEKMANEAGKHGVQAVVDGKSSIEWRLVDAGERDGMPQTAVSVVVNGTAYDMGTYLGSCSEIGASGGVDGTGLLAGELSAVQCWYAGGGDEVGVFANEDGGFDLLVGALSEGAVGEGLFRGDFLLKVIIEI